VDLQQIEGVENALGDIDLHFPSIFQVGDEHFYSVEAAIRYAKQRAIEAGLLAE
jgi:hypothetical protein